MTVQTQLTARISVEGAGFAGQMRAAKLAVDEVKVSFGQAGQAATVLSGQTNAVAQAERAAAASATALAASNRNLATSSTAAAAAAVSQRVGYQQLGLQAATLASQIGGGTGALGQFALQGAQTVSTLQMMRGSAVATGATMGRFASLLGGPLAFGLTTAATLLGVLASELFKTSDAATAAERASESLAARVAELGTFFDTATGKVRATSAALREYALLTRQASIDEQRRLAEGARRTTRNIFDESNNVDSVQFSGTFGREGNQVRINRRDSSLINRVLAARGNPDRIAAELRAIARSGGPQAGRAAQILEQLAITSEATSEIQRLTSEVDSLQSGVLSPDLATARRTTGRRSNGGGASAAAAARRAESSAEFGRDAADRVRAINDQWAAQPRLVQQANAATRQLDDLLDDIERRRPPNMADLIRDIGDARVAIQDGLLRPFREMIAASEQQLSLQRLVLAGRESEAEVQSRLLRLQQQGVDITAEMRSEVERMVAAEARVNDLLDKRDAIIGAYRSSIGELRSSVEELFSGGSLAEFGRSLTENARRLRGRLLSEQLFGDGFRQLEREIRQATGLEGAVDILDQQTRTAADALALFELAVTGAANTIGGDSATPSKAVDRSKNGGPPFAGDYGGGDIVVEGQRIGSAARETLTTMRPGDYFQRVAQVLTAPLARLLGQLDETLGGRLAGQLGGVIEGGIAGYLRAGPVAGVFGAIDGLGLRGSAGRLAGRAAQGAETGALVNQVGQMLGLRGSATGASLGGAIGGALPIPGGALIGSLIGNVVGGLFKKAKTGTATLTSADGSAGIAGNNAAAKSQAGSAAANIQDALRQIADQLGGTLGGFSVSIGVRDGKFRVDPTGTGQTKTKKGALDFGTDGSAAISAAIADAIADGAVSGLSAAIQKALKSSTDVDRALKEALKVQEVELLLGGLGAVLEREFRQFEATAKERLRIATQYGFDVTKIEERNAEDRKKLVDSILTDRVGALQQLLADLRFGDLFEGTAADRRQALLVEAAKAKADAEAGVDGAAQRLADLSRQLVQTSRDAFGTAGPEFGSDRAEAISAAERVIALENERIRLAQETAQGTRAAVERSNELLNEQNDMLARLIAATEGYGGLGGTVLTQSLQAQLSLVQRQVAL